MNFKTKSLLCYLTLILITIGFFCRCSTPKDVAYFQDVTDNIVVLPNSGDIRIKPNDKLSIIVKTIDPNIAAMFNLNVVSDRLGENLIVNSGSGNFRSATNSASGLAKYTVSPEGMIDLPVIGEVKVSGMTRSELAGFVKGELMGRNLAKDPVVTVEFANMGVSVIGEVNNPGRFDINKDRVTLLDAISMAGDLKIQGLRDKIKVLREEDGQVKTYIVDITNLQQLSQSPAYFMEQGDVVYVEPNDMRKRQATTNGNNVYSTSFWISVVSLLTSAVTTVGVFVVK